MAGLSGHQGPLRSVHGKGLPPAFRRALVLGAGRSGVAAAVALAREGMEVVLSDQRDQDSLSGLGDALAAGAVFASELSLGEDWPDPDVVVKSPGVPGEAGAVRLARDRHVPVWSELELAYVLLSNPFDAVTGTNGKTTTTALLGHLFETAGRPARVVGNIGVAVTSLIGKVESNEEIVVEVSSFQLEDIVSFRPAVAVFLNLTPDHLDRHGTLDRYLACKTNMFTRQGAGDVAVLNADDPAIAAVGVELEAKSDGPRVSYFSVLGRGAAGSDGGSTEEIGVRSWVEAGTVYVEGRPIVDIGEILLPGRHNLENCLAAGAAAVARGVSREAVAEGLRTFRGVPHRLERAGMIDGVTYVNDSKATNVEATLTALKAHPVNTHLILGGRDKQSDYRPVARACASGCKAVYLLGEAAPLIEAAFTEARREENGKHVPEVHVCGDLEKAVDLAAQNAVPGDVVLLAPACASFDQYKDFEARGDHFRHLVERLGGSRS